jgi:hypothetical protein
MSDLKPGRQPHGKGRIPGMSGRRTKYPAHTNPDQPQEAGTKNLPTLKGFYSGFPALSHHDGGVVYIMDRHNLDDTNVTLVAVDMRKQTLKGVAGYYSPRPLGYSSVYFGSGISKHRAARPPEGMLLLKQVSMKLCNLAIKEFQGRMCSLK